MQFTFIGVEDDFHHTMMEAWSELFNGSESNTAAGEFVDMYTDVGDTASRQERSSREDLRVRRFVATRSG